MTYTLLTVRKIINFLIIALVILWLIESLIFYLQMYETCSFLGLQKRIVNLKLSPQIFKLHPFFSKNLLCKCFFICGCRGDFTSQFTNLSIFLNNLFKASNFPPERCFQELKFYWLQYFLLSSNVVYSYSFN